MPDDNQSPNPGGTPGAGSGANQVPGGETPPAGQGQAPPTFDAWLTGQDDNTKTLITGHIGGLRSALSSERQAVTDLRKQLVDLTAKLKTDSPERKELETLHGQLKQHQAQAEFYDAAHAAGVTNLRLAWLAAQESRLLSDAGVDWSSFKAQFPELFRLVAPHPGASNPAAERPGGKLTVEAIRKMSPAEINRRWAEVSTALAG